MPISIDAITPLYILFKYISKNPIKIRNRVVSTNDLFKEMIIALDKKKNPPVQIAKRR